MPSPSNAGFDLDPVFENLYNTEEFKALKRTFRDSVMAHPAENRGCDCTLMNLLAHMYELGLIEPRGK